MIAWDFDQTLMDTRALASLRAARDWDRCNELSNQFSFYEGIEDTVAMLAAGGILFRVASKAPAQYLRPFLARLPVRVTEQAPYQRREPIHGLSTRAAIRYGQLIGFKNNSDLTLRIYVGDEVDDAAAADLAGWRFLHACWGAETCEGMGNAIHCKHPDDVLLSVTALQEQYLPLSTTFEMASGDLGDIDKTLHVLQLPLGKAGRIAYIGLYHPKGRGLDDDAQRAIYRFKDGVPRAVGVLARSGAAACRAAFGDCSITDVIPILGSKDEIALEHKPVTRLAFSIAKALGATLNIDGFRQIQAREKLHEKNRGYETRKSLLLNGLACNGQFAHRRILLVDDVVTTGATFESYADLLKKRGAVFVSAFALTKTSRESSSFNLDIFQDALH